MLKSKPVLTQEDVKKVLKKKLKKQASAAKRRLKIKQNAVSEVSAEESIEEDAVSRTFNAS